MEPKTFDFKPNTPNLSREMQATIAKTEAALKQMWEREKMESQSVYEFNIPPQTLTIVGKEQAERVLRSLKELKLSGTYRISKK